MIIDVGSEDVSESRTASKLARRECDRRCGWSDETVDFGGVGLSSRDLSVDRSTHPPKKSYDQESAGSVCERDVAHLNASSFPQQ